VMSTPSRPLAGMVTATGAQRAAAPQPTPRAPSQVLSTQRAPAQLPLFQGPRGAR
jgi:hypothetical protein